MLTSKAKASLAAASPSETQGFVLQGFAAFVCVLLGLAMILNTQMGGEAMWFWYATLWHQGLRLYADLHTPLQPLFVLESDLWMRLFGIRAFAVESLSVLHVLLYCLGLGLVLRQSCWRDWQKAIVLLGTFVVTVVGNSYRFDDYHVVAENLILYTFLGLLWLSRESRSERQLWLVSGIGILCGLTITTRLTDGAALLVSSGLSLVVLVSGRRLLLLVVQLACAIATVLLIVHLTGDGLRTWASTTIFKAAASKGGTGSIFAAPFLFFRNALALMRTAGKGILVWSLALATGGALLARWRKAAIGTVFGVQMGLALLTFLLSRSATRLQLLTGSFIAEMTLALTVVTYFLGALVAVRFLLAKLRPAAEGATWDPREILVAIPLAEWASYSAGAGAEPHTGYYAPVALLLLLFAVVQPLRRVAVWLHASFLTLLALLGLTGITSKIWTPYAWQHYTSSPMFENRVWYQHPLYGPLYIDRDLLRFSQEVCSEIRSGSPHPTLLSLPYPFPNYFCGITPWHGYVQTFFDTSTRASIDRLMAQLNTAPPEWIVYQRQLDIMRGAERLYNHGQPIAQRDLDDMIMTKLANGSWQLVDKKNFLKGDGWFIIRTTRR